jgi:DNA-binding SARP family transcriptional activator
MELRVLGPIEAYESGAPTDLGGPKPRTVLALLVASLGRPVSTDALIEGVYGEAPPVRARRTIQTYVSSLRRVLGNVIRAESHGYVLAIPETQVDACRFEAAVSAAEGIDPVAGLEILDEVLPLWRGRPYADVDGFGLLDPEITRLTELRIRALEDRAETALQLGRHRQLVEEVESP